MTSANLTDRIDRNGDKFVADLIILGSGAAGLTAALCASIAGLKPLVLEHSDKIGGTTARSSGTVWIPNNVYLRAKGVSNDRELAADYLEALVGNRGNKKMWQAFLDNGPRMLDELKVWADISFKPYNLAPDYRQDLRGAAAGGRPLEPLPFDGRKLGKEFDSIGTPLPELMLFGGMMVTRLEAMQLLNAFRSPQAMASSMWLGGKLVSRYFLDRLKYKRGTRLVLGNALVARLYKALLDSNIPILTNAQTYRLVKSGTRICGVEVNYAGTNIFIEARRGVVLAGGGFPANEDMRKQHLPKPVAQYTPASPHSDGSSINLALDAGAVLGENGLDNASWFPSSISKRKDGTIAVYPHIVLDRAKPGMIAVNGNGYRFTNEAVSYHEFARAMYRVNTDKYTQENKMPTWLICDRKFIAKYGLGIIRPYTLSLRKYIKSGYLYEAKTIKELAEVINISPENFDMTIDRYNAFAKTGIDEDFHKGENIYDQSNGDMGVKPNPCIGAITKPPFYSLAIYPTPLGTSRGLSCDIHARVHGQSGKPIAGLYACGNDMQSVFGGEYPGAGAQIGQAMTFAWTAIQHAVNQKIVSGKSSNSI